MGKKQGKKEDRWYITEAEAYAWGGVTPRTPEEQAIYEHVAPWAGGVRPYLPPGRDFVGWEDINGDVVIELRKTYLTMTGRAANLQAIRDAYADRDTTPNIEKGGSDILWDSFPEWLRVKRGLARLPEDWRTGYAMSDACVGGTAFLVPDDETATQQTLRVLRSVGVTVAPSYKDVNHLPPTVQVFTEVAAFRAHVQRQPAFLAHWQQQRNQQVGAA